MAIQGFFTGDVKIRDLNGVLKAVDGIVEVATDAGTVTSVGLTVGSTGTDVNVANSPVTTSGNITLNLPTASATNRGLLSSADWAIFDAKQGSITLTTTGNNGSATLTSGTLNIPTYTLAGLGGISLTSLSASSPLAYNNTTGAFSIQVANGSQGGYLSSSDWTTFNSKQSALTFSSPLVNTAGTVSIPAATSSVNGYLTSTDWTTFNAKQGAITLTTTGSSGAATLIGTTLNIPNYTGALTGYVPYTGATTNVDLGAYDLLVQTLTIGKGNSGLANNTALGYRTLFHITTGNYNTAVGYEAAHNTTTGQYNTALGQSALFTNTTGSQNTALGLNALLSNTTGGSNVVVGLDALQHNTTGSSNTALGYNAGSHITGGSTPNTTASNSVYIGRDSKAKVDGGANEIVIGYNAIGNGSNTATFGNTSTTANYFTGSINGGSFVKSGGTSSQFLKADGSVDSSTYYLASNPSAFIALTALSATAPLSYSNTTGVFSISQATTSTDGYLSSTDWNTFYNKQAAGSYITALTGEATATGPGSATVTLSTSAVTGKLLTGLNLTGGGSIAATDSILQAFGKVQNQISGLAGGVTYQGTWNASTNTPTLTSSVGTKGYYYIVDVAGSTNLNGITDWKIGDWAIFNGSTWDKVDNTDAVSSVNGFTGAVSLTTSNIAEGTNLYYLDSRARLALSFTAGSGAYDNTTGVITIPTNTNQLTNGANFITLSSLSASSPLSYNSGTGAFSIQVANGSQNGYLSSSDWTTFNSKQNAITLTTTGSSGSSTLVGATLNVPTYTLSGLGGVPTSRQLTINGTAYDLSADRSWSVGTVTSVSALTIGTSGTDLSSTVANSTTTPVITLNVPTASATNRGALSSTDWTTFNNKQNALTNPVTGTGTTNYLPKFTGASTIGDSIVSESGTIISILGTLNIRPSAGTSLIDLLSAGAGSKNYQLTSQIIGVSNTGFAIRNVTDSRNELIIDGSGNLGLGVTPSAWGTTGDVPTAFQFGASGILYSYKNTSSSGSHSILGANAYFDGSGFKYINTNSATYYRQYEGTHAWLTASSGTAGNAISFTQAMTLNASGNLSIGNTNDTYKLDVSGSGRFTGNVYINDNAIFGLRASVNEYSIQYRDLDFRLIGSSDASTQRLFSFGYYTSNNIAGTWNSKATINSYTGAATFSSSVTAISGVYVGSGALGRNAFSQSDFRIAAPNDMNILNGIAANTSMTIKSDFYGGGSATPLILQSGANSNQLYLATSGNVGIGTTSPNNLLTLYSASSAIYTQWVQSGTGTSSTDGLRIGLDSSSNGIINLNEGTALITSIDGSERMRITSGGNVGIGTTSPAAILQTQQTSAGSEVTGILIQNVGSSASTAVSLNFAPHENASSPTTLAKISAVRTAVSFAPTDLVFHTFNSTLQERMRITSGGNVGIGTTAPQQALHVNGIVLLENNQSIRWFNNASAQRTLLTLDSNNDFQVGGSISNIRFLTNDSSERMRLNASGNLSIGNTNDSFKLDVSGTGRFTGVVTIGNAVAGTNVELNLNGVANKATRIQFQESGTNSWLIGNGAASENGNFEIYNANGQNALTFVKATSAATFSSSVTVGGSTAQLFLNGSGGYAWVQYQNNGAGDWIHGTNVGGSANDWRLYNYGTSSGALTIAKSNNAATFSSSVEIGQSATVRGFTGTTGAGMFMAYGSAGTGVGSIYSYNYGTSTYGGTVIDGSYVAFYNSGSEKMRITGGNVGIGTTSPAYKLDVVNAGANAIRVQNTDSSADAYFIAQNTTGTSFFGTNNIGPYIYTASALAMQFYTNNAERMRITSGGTLLVGTTTEAFAGGKLQVEGTIRAAGQFTSVLPSSNFGYFDGSGQVVASASSASSLYLDATWNTTGNPDAIFLNITNTASGASAKLLNLKVGSVSQFNVSKAGAITTGALTNGTAQPWKLGNAVSGSLSTNHYIIVEINGTTYSIPALQGLP